MAKYIEPESKSTRSELDTHIGNRVKSRRSFLGISQEKLGNYLGITFQQIQKYEKGVNRISASSLFSIARVLGVDLSYFFDGYREDPAHILDGRSAIYEADATTKKETADLLRSYYKIEDPSVRKKVIELVKTISASQK
ncbi:MAG: helix-turn-helix domain-containing protein [Holosporaceae bacterium]|jgi:transcriptional regulator with XRE-family HTH domain|nr:helix-turn-helix domain-containing protein [Holosporaceae bacterium]